MLPQHSLTKLVNNNDEHCHPYIVECLGKRRKLSSEASSSKREHDYFNDELLVEILCRLPHSKHVIRCKSICKRWAGLISESYFLSRFIASKLTRSEDFGTDTNKMERSFVVVARNLYVDQWKGLMMQLDNPVFNFRNFSLSSLPCVVSKNARTVCVVGAYNDLLLYCRDASDRYYYDIYNIQTRQWLSLPSTPFHYGICIDCWFFCEPYYTFDGGKVNFNAGYRFSVVVAHCPLRKKVTSRHTIHIFSSSSRQWTKNVLLLPKSCSLLRYNNGSFSYAGKLHIRSDQGLIGLDPFEGEKDPEGVVKGRLISWPPGMTFGTACVCVHQGQVRLSRFDDDRLFSAWVLKDYERGEWSLVHTIALNQWVPHDNIELNKEGVSELPWLGTVVGQHPLNPDIIYMSRPQEKTIISILICDTSTRTVKLASILPKSMKLSCCFTSYCLTLPIWPTPLPTLF